MPIDKTNAPMIVVVFELQDSQHEDAISSDDNVRTFLVNIKKSLQEKYTDVKSVTLKAGPQENYSIRFLLKKYIQFLEYLAETGVELQFNIRPKTKRVHPLIHQLISELTQLSHVIKKHEVLSPKNEYLVLALAIIERAHEFYHHLLSTKTPSHRKIKTSRREIL